MGTNHKDKGLPAAHAQVVWPIHKELLQDLEVGAVAQRAAPAGRIVVTEAMHVAACKVLLRAHGLDGLPQRMLDAMLAAANAAPAAPQASQGAAVGVEPERDRLRAAQTAAVMPMIGPLLDAWEQADREVMGDEPELVKWLKAINTAMETAGEDQP